MVFGEYRPWLYHSRAYATIDYALVCWYSSYSGGYVAPTPMPSCFVMNDGEWCMPRISSKFGFTADLSSLDAHVDVLFLSWKMLACSLGEWSIGPPLLAFVSAFFCDTTLLASASFHGFRGTWSFIEANQEWIYFGCVRLSAPSWRWHFICTPPYPVLRLSFYTIQFTISHVHAEQLFCSTRLYITPSYW